MTDKLLTIDDVMKIIPLRRTSVTTIIKTLPYVTMGRKMMVHEKDVLRWIDEHTHYPQQEAPKAAKPKRRTAAIEGLTEDGHIPYRRTARRQTA